MLGPLFTSDPAVRDLLVPVLLVAALAQPVAGVVFVLDGVLIGAGDGRYLAWAELVVLVLFAPAAWLAVAGPGDAGLAVGGVLRRLHGRARRVCWRGPRARWVRLRALSRVTLAIVGYGRGRSAGSRCRRSRWVW